MQEQEEERGTTDAFWRIFCCSIQGILRRNEFPPPKEGPLSCSQSMLVQPERRGEERRARGLWTVYMVKLERDHNKNLFGVFQENEKPTAGTVDFGKRRLLQVG